MRRAYNGSASCAKRISSASGIEMGDPKFMLPTDVTCEMSLLGKRERASAGPLSEPFTLPRPCRGPGVTVSSGANVQAYPISIKTSNSPKVCGR